MNYDIVFIAKQALILSLILSLPVVIIASLVGLLFSLFQALTQIQDQTLSFAIKLVFIILVLYFTVDWMASKIFSYTLMLYTQIYGT
ncbi:MAG: type III secretion system export apparatus subunit SctS [Burkholderiales bacterium]|jgi:type III secretion protein S